MSPRDARRDALCAFAIALAARLGFVAWAHRRFPAAEDGRYYDVLARRLASGAGYTWQWPDGAVTYAAHYPVGYPALLALAYAVVGASPAVAMTVNGLLGAGSAYAAHRIVDGPGVARWRPFAAGLVIALHPALLPYTAAVMTEGVTASLLMIAAAMVGAAQSAGAARSRAKWVAMAGICYGIATLVRPQSMVVAPILGALAVRTGAGARARLASAAATTAIAMLCVAPWTARNCEKMGRCALVSVNGGWNLLVGAQSESGAWEPVRVPPECATIWDEAGKDACFGGAARRAIVAAPGTWLARAPAKVAATLDYIGAGPWYLHASAPSVVDEQAKERLGAIETVICRLLLLGAIVVSGRMRGSRFRERKLVALLGAAGALTVHGWIGYVAVALCVALAGLRTTVRAPVAVPATAVMILVTVVVHATFFGAGRYGLVAVPFVGAMAFASYEGSSTYSS